MITFIMCFSQFAYFFYISVKNTQRLCVDYPIRLFDHVFCVLVTILHDYCVLSNLFNKKNACVLITLFLCVNELFCVLVILTLY